MDGKIFAGKYRVVREISAESAGRTYLATAPDGATVVVKVLRPADETAATVVEDEVSLVSGIRHPALPRIYEWGHDGSDFFLVREWLPGADLKTELDQQGRFSADSAARYGADVADALEQIHARGVIHGNVKTANVIRTSGDTTYLVGYSLGLQGDAARAMTNARPSIAHYLAPEQVDGTGLMPATDVYALGVVLYELVSGSVPFDGASAAMVADQQCHAVPRALRDRVPGVPAEFDRIVMKALEKSAEARYPTAAAMRDDLERFAAGSSAPVTAPPLAVEAPAATKWWLWMLLGILVVAIGVGAAFALGGLRFGGVTVPDVYGTPLREATASIVASGLGVGSITYAGGPVAGVDDGSVASQSPAPGVRTDSFTKVDLVLAGVEMVAVPEVTGQSEAQAIAAIRVAGFVVDQTVKEMTTTVDPGTVLGQSPVAGTLAPRGSGVVIRLAQAGPLPIGVPDLTSMAQAEARTALQTAGFAVKVLSQSSSTVASGTVISQNPTAGVAAKPGSTVTIVVSSGPAIVVVPDVVTKTQADAVNALTAAGFKAQVTEQTGGGTVGTVVDQSPNAGGKAPAGSVVVITVVK
ncbi:MAG: PASTA domain-containing protein [Coriobacteriia bacterium]|nr:PASTA domain-containing protein [Coriobacteriia bacterium]